MEATSYFVWSSSPEMFSLGPLSIRWYGVFFALSFLIGLYIMTRIFELEKKKEADLNQLFYFIIAGTVIGARLGHCLFYEPGFYLSNPIEILKIWRGGLASHGGGIGIITAVYLYSKRHNDQNMLWVLDRLSLPTMLGSAFIRLGNFFNSEIIGNPTEVPWAVVFVRIDMLPRHPTMLYESAVYIVIFAILMAGYWLWQWQKRPGLIFGSLLSSVFVARFFIEFTKTRQASYGVDLPISVGQWLSIPFVLVGVYLLYRALTSTKTS
jgi:prolipoprotein diacylglyceryl transferase